MAEEEQEEAEAEAPPPPSPQPTRYIILIVFIMLIEAGGGYLFLDYTIPAHEVPPEEEEVEEQIQPTYVKPVFYDGFSDMIVNPSGSSRNMLVMLSMTLQLGPTGNHEAALEELDIKRDLLWDGILSELEKLEIKDIRSPEKEELKETVQRVVNEELRNGSISGVYVTKIVLQ